MRMSGVVDIGSRLELMLDDYLIERYGGKACLRLHPPTPRETALVTDRPWEGNACGYATVFKDEDGYRMYYRAWHLTPGEEARGAFAIALARSADGKHWERPELGLCDFRGSRANNLVFVPTEPERKGEHGFSPFKDANPDCPPEIRYKAVGAGARCRSGLYALGSPDGRRWRLLQDAPIIAEGAFDSQNLVFWDSLRGQYRAYIRDFRHPVTGRRDYQKGFRCIRTATSPDFFHWTDPEWLSYPGSPDEHLYTNQIIPYYRAPHLFVGFPTRYVERGWGPGTEALPELDQRRLRAQAHPRYGMALTDGLFMSSRDGKTFTRWGEAFIRPGLRTAGNWVYGDNYQNWGIVETASDLPGAPPELSVYVTEGYWRGTANAFRRFTLRVDGFVSLHAPASGGEAVTRPILFEGDRLLLNVATSAAGRLRIEIQNPDGVPLDGFHLADSPDMFGDSLAYPALWRDPAALARLAGRPVRLRFVLQDADLYAFRFSGSGTKEARSHGTAV